MRQRIMRVAYRIASPLARLWWGLWRIDLRGAKCVITNGGEILLVRHTYGDRRRWELPGGFVRRGEDPGDAARREMDEELGLALGPGQLKEIAALGLRLGRRHDTIHYFHVGLADRAVLPDPVELAEVAWFKPGALPRPLGRHVRQILGRIPATNALASLTTDPGSPSRG